MKEVEYVPIYNGIYNMTKEEYEDLIAIEKAKRSIRIYKKIMMIDLILIFVAITLTLCITI